MGWDGMGFTLLRGWDGTLSKGRKRKRKRNNPIGEKRTTVPNQETEGLRRIHGVFLRSERGEFYRFERRILKRFLSWGWIEFDSVTNSPPQPTLSNGLARGIKSDSESIESNGQVRRGFHHRSDWLLSGFDRLPF